jgi:hypothetical protein
LPTALGKLFMSKPAAVGSKPSKVDAVAAESSPAEDGRATDTMSESFKFGVGAVNAGRQRPPSC